MNVPLDRIDTTYGGKGKQYSDEKYVRSLAAKFRKAGRFTERHVILACDKIEGRIPRDARFDLVDGHHRFEAAKRARLKTIPAMVYDPME